jgi:hypothetical protein
MERILIQAAPRLDHDPSFATVISSAAPERLFLIKVVIAS